MAILSLTSVMGPVLRSTSQRSPQRITAATTAQTIPSSGKVENSCTGSPAGRGQLSRPTAGPAQTDPHHRIRWHLFGSTDSIALHQILHTAASNAAGIWTVLRQHIAATTMRCSSADQRSATLRHNSAAARQSTTSQSTAWQHCAHQQHKTRLRTAAVCDSKDAASVQMLRHRTKAALHSHREHHSHFTADHRPCKISIQHSSSRAMAAASQT